MKRAYRRFTFSSLATLMEMGLELSPLIPLTKAELQALPVTRSDAPRFGGF